MRTENHGRKTRIATAVAASAIAVLTATTAYAPDAYAYEKTQSFTWEDGTPEPQPPAEMQDVNGKTMTLQSQTAPVQVDSSQTVTQHFEQVNEYSFTNITGDPRTAIRAQIPNTTHISSDGYDGDIELVRWTPTEVRRNWDETVKITRDFPATQDPRSTIEQDGVSYSNPTKIGSHDEEMSGEVITYNTYEYTGTVQRSEVERYNVSAVYAGDLTKVAKRGSWSKTATYTAPDDPIVPQQPDNQSANSNANVPANTNEGDNANTTYTTGNSFTVEENQNNDNSDAIENDNSNNASNENSDSKKEEKEEEEESGGIPLFPLALAGGAAILVAAGAGVFLFLRRRRADDGEPDEPDEAQQQQAAAMAAAARRARPVSGNLESMLIELFDVNNQHEKAVLGIEPSTRPDVPTVITLPEMGGIHFEPVPGADYYVGISDISGFQSDRLLVVSAEGQTVYDGPLAAQFKLNSAVLADALNQLPPDGVMRRDVSQELAYYRSIANVAADPLADIGGDIPANSPLGVYGVQQVQQPQTWSYQADDLLGGIDSSAPGYEPVSSEAHAHGFASQAPAASEGDSGLDSHVPETVEAAAASYHTPAEQLVDLLSDDEFLSGLDETPAYASEEAAVLVNAADGNVAFVGEGVSGDWQSEPSVQLGSSDEIATGVSEMPWPDVDGALGTSQMSTPADIGGSHPATADFDDIVMSIGTPAETIANPVAAPSSVAGPTSGQDVEGAGSQPATQSNDSLDDLDALIGSTPVSGTPEPVFPQGAVAVADVHDEYEDYDGDYEDDDGYYNFSDLVDEMPVAPVQQPQAEVAAPRFQPEPVAALELFDDAAPVFAPGKDASGDELGLDFSDALDVGTPAANDDDELLTSDELRQLLDGI